VSRIVALLALLPLVALAEEKKTDFVADGGEAE